VSLPVKVVRVMRAAPLKVELLRISPEGFCA
jgi:hypothetical protein